MKFGTGLNTELTQKYKWVKVQNDICTSKHIYVTGSDKRGHVAQKLKLRYRLQDGTLRTKPVTGGLKEVKKA